MEMMPTKKTITILVLILSFILIVTSIQTSLASIILTENNLNNNNQFQNTFPKYKKIMKENSPTNTVNHENISTEYIIITPKEFVQNFQSLIDHKSKYIFSKIVTVEEITDNKSFWVNGKYGDGNNKTNGNPYIPVDMQVTKNFSFFNDTAAKIRNFIRFAHFKWKSEYVLLGGDTEFIPSRSFYGYIPNWSAGKIVKPIQALIVSDHYYSALNGTWNNDFDDRFGEEPAFSTTDEADFTSEVIIGRAPVNDAHEANIFVHKVISYETSNKPKNVQFHQSYTNTQHIPDTTRVTSMCQKWIPENFNLYTLYEKNGKVTVDNWKESFSNPEKLILFHVGNGYNDGLYSWYQLSWNGQKRIKFNVLDAGSLSNSFYPIHISISCLTNDFSENECLSEEILLTRNGGPSACIGNTEVGCISRDDAGTYSAEFFEQIFKNIFDESIQHLGKSVQQAKEYFSDISAVQRQYRWCFYTINLLGDPETPILLKRTKNDNNSVTVWVDDDYSKKTPGWNETKFNTIQSAIDKSIHKGKIIINEGRYKEHLRINKTLSLKGVDKSNVIISNDEKQKKSLLQLSCHSTLIQNLTIEWDQSSKITPNALIHILPTYNGNTIKNNIIKGSGNFGVLLTNSIRNTIDSNYIIHNNQGIGVINDLGGLFPSKVIVTCDNIISNNRIENYRNNGVLIKGSIHNYIFNNTFIKNSENKIVNQSTFFNNHLQLINTKLNEIHNNYWNKAVDEPYAINTLKGPITLFTLDISRGLVFKLFKCVLILNLGYPSTVFDLAPAQNPSSP